MKRFLITVMCRKPPRLPVRLDIYYYIMDDGTESRTTEICRDYLALLQRMVAQKGALLAHRRRFREGRPYRY
jgi:hypothetical protein